MQRLCTVLDARSAAAVQLPGAVAGESVGPGPRALRLGPDPDDDGVRAPRPDARLAAVSQRCVSLVTSTECRVWEREQEVSF